MTQMLHYEEQKAINKTLLNGPRKTFFSDKERMSPVVAGMENVMSAIEKKDTL